MSGRRQETRPDPQPDARVLPYNMEAERSVLGAIILHNGAYEHVSETLSAQHFFRDAHRRIYLSIERLLKSPDGLADFVTLKEDLGKRGDLDEVGGPAYVAALVDGVPKQTNIRHYADIVREKSLLRSTITVANKMLADAYEAEESAATIIGEADLTLIELQRSGRSGRMQDLRTSSGTLLQDLEYRVAHRGELTGIDAGFRSINELTSGWQPGDMIVVAARPSIGKTAFVMNSVVAGARSRLPQPTVAAVFSMEMRRKQLEYRILGGLSGIPVTRLLGGVILSDDEWQKLNAAITIMHDCAINIEDTAGLTVQQIRSACRRLKAEDDLHLVVLDYVQLVPGTLQRKGATRNEELTDISRRLKVMADELSVPIIVLSQLKRTGGARPTIEDLRDSGSLEQDADIVAFLHRKHHRESGVTNFIIDKQRNGPTGTVNLTLDRDLTLFTDGGEETPPTPEEQAQENKDRRKVYAIRNRRRA